MKRELFLILLLFIFSVSYAQDNQSDIKLKNSAIELDSVDIECIYELSYKRKTDSAALEYIEDMVLQIGKKGISKFESTLLVYRDSLIMEMKKMYLQQVGSGQTITIENSGKYPNAKYKHRIYKNYPENTITVLNRVFTDKFEYVESLNMFDWKIENEMEFIEGFHCQKATVEFSGRKWEAWFTDEIPVREGPYKFNGLPGLIVAISDTQQHYNFKLKSIIHPKQQKPILFKRKRKTIQCSKSDFFKEEKKYYSNFEAYAINITFFDPEQIKRLSEKKAKEYNPIELLVTE